MYEAFYGLNQKPFSINPDPEFLYWAQAHSMAFTMLEYGVLNRAGFTVVTGEIGSGKTTLIRHLLNKLPGDVTVGLVSNAREDSGDLLPWVMMALGQDFDGISPVLLYQKFETYLIDQYAQSKRTVIIIDEAQNLGAKALEGLRMMSNINADKHDLLQIILVGQPELKDLLCHPSLVQFAQRVSSDFHLGVLDREDVPHYIDHRLRIAGSERLLFSDHACDLIDSATNGTPRLINILCDTALMYAYASEAQQVTSQIIRAVIEDKRRYGVFSTRPVARIGQVA